MSWLADAMKTIESVVLLRSKVEQLDSELGRTQKNTLDLARGLFELDKRVIRLEVLEEVRAGRPSPAQPRITDQ